MAEGNKNKPVRPNSQSGERKQRPNIIGENKINNNKQAVNNTAKENSIAPEANSVKQTPINRPPRKKPIQAQTVNKEQVRQAKAPKKTTGDILDFNSAEEEVKTPVSDDVLDFGDNDDEALDFGNTEQQSTEQPESITEEQNNETEPAETPKATKKRKQLINTEEENAIYDEFNQDLVEDSFVQELNKKDEEAAKKVKTPEQIKKAKKIKIGVIAGVVVLLVGACTIKLLTADKGVNFTEINVQDYISTRKPPENSVSGGNSGNSSSNTGKPAETVDFKIDGITEITGSIGNIDEYKPVDTVVNIKESSDSAYLDHDAKYWFGVSQMICGLDNIQSYIDEYNKISDTVLNISDSDLGSDLTLAMVEVTFKYPENYPTNLGSGKVVDVPQTELEFIGTYVDEIRTEDDYSEYIVVDDVTYKINEPMLISRIPSSVSIEEGLTYRYIIQMPIGAKASDYIMYITQTTEQGTEKIQVNGIDITK